MKRPIRAADETEEPPLEASPVRDDLDHHRPAARLVYRSETPTEKDEI